MRLRHLIPILVLILGAAFIASIPAPAQDDAGACPAVVDQALAAVGDNCADMPRNSACYGYNNVNATFSIPVDSGYFTHPADQTELTTLETIRTMPLDAASDTWGIAVMNVQANVPNTLPGQAVIFMLVGDAQITNAVAPDAAFTPADPIAVTTSAAGSNVRARPDGNAPVLGSVPAGTEFETDARSADGQWYRVIFNDQVAWISGIVLAPADGLDALPVLDDSTLTPMQAFYFSTGTGNPQCNGVPDSVIIQGPNNVAVTLNANGADITIGSTIMLRDGTSNTLMVGVISGHAEVEGLIIPAGFTIAAHTDDQGRVMAGSWTGFRAMTQDELDQIQALPRLNPRLLHYAIQPPTLADIATTRQNLQAGQVRAEVIARCHAANLDQEECQRFVSGLTDRVEMYRRCVAAGVPDNVCQQIAADGQFSPVERCRLQGGTQADCANATESTGDMLALCQSAGYATLADCQAAFPNADPDIIAQCLQAGYSTGPSCHDAGVDQILDVLEQACRSGGYTTAAECRAAFPNATINMIIQCLQHGYTTGSACRDAVLPPPPTPTSIPHYLLVCQAAGVGPAACTYIYFGDSSKTFPQRCMAAGVGAGQCQYLYNNGP